MTRVPPLRTRPAALALLGLLLCATGCRGSQDDPTTPSPTSASSPTSSAAAPVTAADPSADSEVPSSEPGTLPTGTRDPVAQRELADLAAQEGALASTTPAAAGAPDVGVLQRSDPSAGPGGGPGTSYELLVHEGGRWRSEAVLPAPEPAVDGRPLTWRRLTGGAYPDLVVTLQGGSLTGFLDVAVASRDGGAWHWVPRRVRDETDGVPVLLGNPVFDAGPVFATRSAAGGQVVARHWRYDPATGTFVPTDPPT